MSVAKVIEVLAESEISWEEATKDAVKEVSKTIKHIQSVYIESFQAVVKNDQIVKYRVNAKVTFIVD
ncbi:MAG TPA: dodecin family protein [Caldisericia bacterium]|nr:dodecin family protein [Caldisericia bacterium]